ncbi:MAG: hypothetical protein KDD58_00840 [Bdellovibrionales bacterium]|nr:hypothetical protein [Bdellovibrionales bacterium]
MKYLLFSFLTFFNIYVLSAPMPATSSSDFLKIDIGLFRSPLGFEVSSEKTNWLHSEVPKEQKFIATVYKAPQSQKGVQPLLTVRLDSLNKSKTLNQYMRDWVKTYPRLGFQVLGTQKVTIENKRGFLIDLIHNKSHRQVRQVVFVKDKKAIVMSCRGHQDGFRTIVKSCNQIFRNFKWI